MKIIVYMDPKKIQFHVTPLLIKRLKFQVQLRAVCMDDTEEQAFPL
jgi:hypothetical protein